MNTGEMKLSKPYVFLLDSMGTMQAKMDNDLYNAMTGAIVLQPYNSDTELMERFKEWLNKRTLGNLPRHPWTET